MSAPARAPVSPHMADKNSEAKGPSQHERGFFQLAQRRTEGLRFPHCCCLSAILEHVTPEARRQSAAADSITSTPPRSENLHHQVLTKYRFLCDADPRVGPISAVLKAGREVIVCHPVW